MIPQTCFIEIFNIAAKKKLIANEPVIPYEIIENAELNVFCKTVKIICSKSYMILAAEEALERRVLGLPLHFHMAAKIAGHQYFNRLKN
jgi:hypothetical protein